MRRLAAFVIACWAVGGCGSLREQAAAPPYSLHGAGFAEPRDPNYHGALLRQWGFDFGSCKTCHGSDLSGGDVGVSCARCHPGGPTACTTCHGLPPQTGAHIAHVALFPCQTCHVVPAQYDAPGHLTGIGGAPVVFSGLATNRATPSYANGRCSNTYCHGATMRGGTHTTPSWTEGRGAAECGSCHAVPPPDHFGEGCQYCHGLVVDASRQILNQQLHVDGVVQARDLSAGCSSCHGPPQDLGGAHAAHLSGAHGRAVPCTECHVVPATIGAPGHMNGQVEVRFGPLASRDSLSPAWDATRCTQTYCHGQSLPGGSNRSPSWRGGPGQAACGTCHGVPMPNHFGERCSDCHSAVVDRSNRIIRPDLHLNGRIDLGETP